MAANTRARIAGFGAIVLFFAAIHVSVTLSSTPLKSGSSRLSKVRYSPARPLTTIRHRLPLLPARASIATSPETIHDVELKKSPIYPKLSRKSFSCAIGGNKVEVTYDAQNPDIPNSVPTLFLATPSFVPSRATFIDLASAMTDASSTVLPILTELPGYGLNDGALTNLDEFKPKFFREYLAQFLDHLSEEYGQPVNIVSAGHAGFYVLDALKANPALANRVFLINPTYRGPLTTVKMKNEASPVVPKLIDALCGGIASAYKLPAPIGTAVHASQCSEGSIKKAMISHVYENPMNVTAEAIEINRQFAAQGERWGKCAFLVGRTDPYPRREDAAKVYSEGAPVPTALCVGAKERDAFEKDLDFLTNSGVEMIVTPGAQRNFVEFPQEVATAALSFLKM
mmetsp:Transcript_9245/g.13888  ORF Transcript_9245/g.13888 Transcript_9245/m.13888 type:complete len:398 (+) Transcript_9245:46-1239(+)